MIIRPRARTLRILPAAFIVAVLLVAATGSIGPASVRWLFDLLIIGGAMTLAWWAGVTGEEARQHLPAVPVHKIASIRRDTRLPSFDRDTGLCATWYFRLRIDEEIARAERYRQVFTLVTVSAPTAEAMTDARVAVRKSLRSVDLAGSLGDAIAVLLPNTGMDGARSAMERIAADVPELACRASEYPTDGTTLSALLGEHEWFVDDADPPAATESATA
jgi:hypothetical protein